MQFSPETSTCFIARDSAWIAMSAAASDARHKRVHFSFHLLPDLRSGFPAVDLRIPGVFKLLHY
jgi:hypothetical protein